jgi:hypothetical protein
LFPAFLLTVWIASAASAQDRKALVIANFDYGERQLSHAKADSAAVGVALRREGFRVTLAENVPVNESKDTLEQFARTDRVAESRQSPVVQKYLHQGTAAPVRFRNVKPSKDLTMFSLRHNNPKLHRRELLRVGGLALVGLSLPGLPQSVKGAEQQPRPAPRRPSHAR